MQKTFFTLLLSAIIGAVVFTACPFNNALDNQPTPPIATQYAGAWEYFTISGVPFLAVANHATTLGNSFQTDSHIHQWNGTAFDIENPYSLATIGAIDMEYFTIGTEQFLAVANHRDGTNYSLLSTIYKITN